MSGFQFAMLVLIGAVGIALTFMLSRIWIEVGRIADRLSDRTQL